MQILLTNHTMVNSDPPPPTAADVARAKESALHELRAVTAAMAADKGHQLGTWRDAGPEEEVAYCRSCRRAAYITLVRPPHFAGQALSQKCQRPDAFLVNQHASDLAGGGR